MFFFKKKKSLPLMTIGVFAANGYSRQTAQRGRSRALMNTLRSDAGRSDGHRSDGPRPSEWRS